VCLLRRHVAVDRRWQRALSPHLLCLVLLMVHLIRLCLHFGVSHPGAQVVDLAQADSRQEARYLAMALARIAPRRISARVTEFGLAHRRAEQEKQRYRPHRTFASPQGPLHSHDNRGGRELFEFGLQGRASRMQTVGIQ
jgi:hypothetical protein